MTDNELNKLTSIIYSKVRGVPGVDQVFVKKCLVAVSNMGDREVEEKLKKLIQLF